MFGQAFWPHGPGGLRESFPRKKLAGNKAEASDTSLVLSRSYNRALNHSGQATPVLLLYLVYLLSLQDLLESSRRWSLKWMALRCVGLRSM